MTWLLTTRCNDLAPHDRGGSPMDESNKNTTFPTSGKWRAHIFARSCHRATEGSHPPVAVVFHSYNLLPTRLGTGSSQDPCLEIPSRWPWGTAIDSVCVHPQKGQHGLSRRIRRHHGAVLCNNRRVWFERGMTCCVATSKLLQAPRSRQTAQYCCFVVQPIAPSGAYDDPGSN